MLNSKLWHSSLPAKLFKRATRSLFLYPWHKFSIVVVVFSQGILHVCQTPEITEKGTLCISCTSFFFFSFCPSDLAYMT